MSQFVDGKQLLNLRGTVVEGAQQTIHEVLAEEPLRLIDVGAPSAQPFGLATYRVRLRRSQAGQGPTTHGLSEFVAALESLAEPGRPAVLTGQVSTYVLLLDAGLTRIIASTAIDPPSTRCEECGSTD